MSNSGQLELVISSLSSCRLEDARKDDFANGLFQVGKLIPATFVSGTLDEMRSSGSLGLVKSLRLRNALNEAERELEHENLVWPPVWARARFADIDQRVIFWVNGPKGGFDRADWSELASDFHSLCSDQTLLAALSVMQRQVYMNIDWLDRNLENFRRAKSLLDVELGRSPDPTGTTP